MHLPGTNGINELGRRNDEHDDDDDDDDDDDIDEFVREFTFL
jgi:hypothetical protein